jgi:hypothetical protein
MPPEVIIPERPKDQSKMTKFEIVMAAEERRRARK